MRLIFSILGWTSFTFSLLFFIIGFLGLTPTERGGIYAFIWLFSVGLFLFSWVFWGIARTFKQ